MIPGLVDLARPAPIPGDGEWHVLVVARDAGSRRRVSDRLLDTGFRIATAATFGVVEVLLRAHEPFDLMIVAQSAEEIGQFGVPQLARSIDADLPILVLEFGTEDSPAVIDLVQDVLSRWSLRERAHRPLH